MRYAVRHPEKGYMTNDNSNKDGYSYNKEITKEIMRFRSKQDAEYACDDEEKVLDLAYSVEWLRLSDAYKKITGGVKIT